MKKIIEACRRRQRDARRSGGCRVQRRRAPYRRDPEREDGFRFCQYATAARLQDAVLMQTSPLLTQLMEALRCLPGVGPKSAQRMAFTLLQRDRSGGMRLAQALTRAMSEIGHCADCRTFTEQVLPYLQQPASPGKQPRSVCRVRRTSMPLSRPGSIPAATSC